MFPLWVNWVIWVAVLVAPLIMVAKSGWSISLPWGSLMNRVEVPLSLSFRVFCPDTQRAGNRNRRTIVPEVSIRFISDV